MEKEVRFHVQAFLESRWAVGKAVFLTIIELEIFSVSNGRKLQILLSCGRFFLIHIEDLTHLF